MCNINDFGFNSYCLSWVKKVSHGSVGWLRCHNSEDMGMLGIPCPLFSRLNSKTRSHKWNPFREQLGMCWHCWLDFTTWLTLGCSSQSVSVWPVFTISVDFFATKGDLLPSLQSLEQASCSQSENLHSGGGKRKLWIMAWADIIIHHQEKYVSKSGIWICICGVCRSNKN